MDMEISKEDLLFSRGSDGFPCSGYSLLPGFDFRVIPGCPADRASGLRDAEDPFAHEISEAEQQHQEQSDSRENAQYGAPLCSGFLPLGG